VLQVILNRPGQRHRLGITADSHQIILQVGMINALYFLLNNRPLIQIRGHVVGRRAYQFYPAILGLLV
jgi:hypothetical protein